MTVPAKTGSFFPGGNTPLKYPCDTNTDGSLIVHQMGTRSFSLLNAYSENSMKWVMFSLFRKHQDSQTTMDV